MKDRQAIIIKILGINYQGYIFLKCCGMSVLWSLLVVALYFFLYRTHTPASFINWAVLLRLTGKLSVFYTS
jgi:hypothetical protein